MAQNQLERQLTAGVRAARQGNKERARELLEGVLKSDRENEQAWIWMASIVNSTRERRICLERVLKINPSNRAARAAINSMVGVIGGEGTSIDFDAMSRAAKTPLPAAAAAAGSGQQSRAGAGTSAGTGAGPNFTLILAGVGAALVLIVLAVFVLPALFASPPPPPTAIPTVVEVTEEVTAQVADDGSTPVPTATFTPESIATLSQRDDLPTEIIVPTEAPTETEVPTEVPTVAPVANYNLILLITEGSLAPTLYEVSGDGSGLKPLAGNMYDMDVHPNGALTFTREQEIILPSPTPRPTNTPDPQMTADPNDAIVRTPQPRTAIISKLFVTTLNNPLEAIEISNETHENTFSPSISPDGQQIAFASDADGDNDIYIYDIPSRTIFRVTNSNGASDIEPDWSPDGTQMVFASDRESPGRYDLYILTLGDNVEDSVVRITETRRGDNRHPQWSPNGDQIAFLNQVASNSGIRMVTISTGAIRELTSQASNIYTAPAWTPDGIYVVYASNTTNPNRQVFFVDPITLYRQQIVMGGSDVKLPIPISIKEG